MIVIAGILLVAAAVVGGYIMEEGQLMVLFQPAEFVIIFGAAIGSLLVGTPPKVLKATLSQLSKIMRSGPSKKAYIDLLVMMYQLFNVARKDGLVGLESHVERPEESSIIKKYPRFIKDRSALNFLSDTMRIIIMGVFRITIWKQCLTLIWKRITAKTLSLLPHWLESVMRFRGSVSLPPCLAW
jgi:chemotaxis protein MotA